MQKDWQQYSLQQLREHAVDSFREGGGSRPDVLLICIDDHYAVLKDQNGADKWFAKLIGPILTWRECKALNRLSALDCIPDLLHRPDARSFLMSYHPSEPITRLKSIEPDWPELFDKMSAAIKTMHQAGVAHNDLRNHTNTLVTEDGKIILVDLVACFCQGAKWNVMNQWLFNKFCQVDHSAITKLKNRVAPELITEDDVVAEKIAGKAGMAARSLGQSIRKLSRLIFTK